MASDKNFLTYNQQMKKLRKDKNISCKNTTDKTTLVKMGYFNLVNGYKEPFICGRTSDDKHIYIANTSLESLYVLKKFDDSLRILLLKYISQIEEEVRTITGYKFDQSHGMILMPIQIPASCKTKCMLFLLRMVSLAEADPSMLNFT